MDFQDTISAGLPAPRNAEPATLRDAIIDELADHLACAYKNELLRGAEPNAARARVLERFGDPAAVARRLWLDAMKGKIMSQRILIGMVFLLTVICCALFGLVWQQATRAERQAAEANQRLVELFTRAQVTDHEMLKQLQAVAWAVQPGQSPDWIPVSLRLTQETIDGPPAVGVEAQLAKGGTGFRGRTSGATGRRAMGFQGAFFNSRQGETIQRVSDENGLVDFGVVHPGDWQLYLTRWDKGPIAWRASTTLNVLPGIKIVKPIICPKTPPDAARVQLRVSWPADLEGHGYLVEAWFEHAGVAYQPSLHWTFGHDLGAGRIRDMLCMTRGPETKQTELGSGEGLFFWDFAAFARPEDLGNEASDSKRLFADLRADQFALEPGTSEVDAGEYKLVRIVVLHRRTPPSHKPSRERFDVLGHASVNWEYHPPVYMFTKPPMGDDYKARGAQGLGQLDEDAPYNRKRVAASDAFWEGAEARFEAQPRKVSEWTFGVPDELVNSLRHQLKPEEPGRAKRKAQ
jgi:hypothetical protein